MSVFGRISSLLSTDTATDLAVAQVQRHNLHDQLQRELAARSLPNPLSDEQRDLFNWLASDETENIDNVRARLALCEEDENELANWEACTHTAISEVNLTVLERICKGGFNMDFVANNQLQFTCFQMAGAVYDNSVCEESLGVIKLLAFYSSKTHVFKELQSLLRQCDITADILQEICINIVEGSFCPITTSLQVAALAALVADRILTKREAYLKTREFFTGFALKLLHSLNSNHLQALALEIPDESGENAMDVAIKDRNVRFVSDVQVSRILSTIWATPKYMTSIEFIDYGIDRKCKTIVALLITAPNEFFRSNRGKFVIWAFGFLAFLVLFSIMGIRGVVINDSLRTLESIVWVMGTHYIIGEFVEIYNRGVTNYWTSAWNICDSLFSIVFMCIMFVRWISFPLTDDSPLIENRQQMYNMLMAFGTILIWLRVSYLFVINATLGPFIRVMACFVRDVYVFLYLLLVLMVGFGIALHIVVGNVVESHRTVLGSIFTLYQAGLGEFSFDSFQELPPFQHLTAQTLLAVYLACAAVVLVNLLIAMLAETFSSIQQDQRLEFMFGRAVTTWDLNRSNNVLPPPFNGLVYGIALIFRILSCCYSPSWSRDNHDENCEDDLESNVPNRKVSKDWCCARCHGLCKGKSEVDAFIDVRHWSMSIHLKVPDSLRHVQTLPITLCSHCHRLKHPISRAGLLREQISYMVFLLCIFLPALILLLLPTLVHLAVSVIYQRLSKTRYWYSLVKRTSYIRRHLTGRKRLRDIDGKASMKSSKWVSLNYQEFSTENEAA